MHVLRALLTHKQHISAESFASMLRKVGRKCLLACKFQNVFFLFRIEKFFCYRLDRKSRDHAEKHHDGEKIR